MSGRRPDAPTERAGTTPINRFFSDFPESTRDYMSGFWRRFSRADVADLFDAMRGLDVLVVGDTILDDYHFCRTLGTSSKDPALAVLHESSEMFAGGVLAVANHVANFAGGVRLVTPLGDADSHRPLVESKLGRNIRATFVTKKGAPTTVKRRFVDAYFVNKLFEVYEMDDAELAPDELDDFHEAIARGADGSDVVIAADFGHGAIATPTRGHLMEVAPFLAVNTQANAGNRGFHTIGAYARSDYASISEGEIRLEFRDTHGPLAPMLEATAARLGTRAFTVTRGQNGCLVKGRDEDVVRVPSFTPRIIDRVGAGDALFALTSMACHLGAPPELLGFVGNVVGGLAVEVLGNKKSIDRASVDTFLDSLLLS